MSCTEEERLDDETWRRFSLWKQPLRDYVDKERGGEGEERLKEYPMFLGQSRRRSRIPI